MNQRVKRIRPGVKQRRFRQRLVAYRERRTPRARRRIPRAAVPSFFTLMNLFCGFLSLTQTLEGNFAFAAWLIVLAGFFDLLDGMMARLTNGDSLFGVELDSLSDVVSFGVAPAFLIYVFGLSEFGTLGVIVASLPAICGAVRLARFNVNLDGKKSDYFTGLPIPGQAAAIVAIVLNAGNLAFLDPAHSSRIAILIPTVVVLSGLMLTNVEFDSVPRPTAAYLRTHPVKSIMVLAGILTLIVFHELGLLVNMTVYLAMGVGRAILRFGRAVASTELHDDVN
jgi:CDP-diacylglycerol---serine O-phosphatidyltransferase